jgi:coenzyme F420 hydrogenase subunit beta
LALNIATAEFITPEMGPVRKLVVSRAADGAVRARGQHGGTVSALAGFALQQGLVDAWLMASPDGPLGGVPTVCRTPEEVAACAGTRLTSVPMVAGFLELARRESGKFGVVATPCQCLALARIKASDHANLRQAAQNLGLVIGLFCGWAFDLRDLHGALEPKLDLAALRGLDIPPSSHHALEAATAEGFRSLPLDLVTPTVRSSCAYCFDMTSELADLSVGSARLPEGWQEARHWNQTVLRSEAGMDLMERAAEAGALVLREPPGGALDKLKAAAAGKKRTARKNLAELSGDPQDLVYLPSGFGPEDPPTGHGA